MANRRRNVSTHSIRSNCYVLARPLRYVPQRDVRRLLLAVLAIVAVPSVALAGMPGLTFTDIASLRLEAISFFLVGFLVCAWFIQLLWNGVLRELARLPRLTYAKSVGLTLIWGLMFLLVLTMISGARELMTPGAWQKNGLTYKLAAGPPEEKPADDHVYAARLEKLAMLRDALWQYAKQHEGQLPVDIESSGLADDLWRVPDASGMRYLFFGGTIAKADTRLVALEPAVFHDRQLALTAGGVVGRLGDIDLTYGPPRPD
ncbi:MAG TPA: hypothetical protein VNH11_28450 [Pirellulales bacterium]|nr:hypothetical protein [Pirellulales bacterium]